MIVKISINAVKHYLGRMIGGWFCDHDVEAEFLEEYKADTLGMLKQIKKHGDEKYMQLTFAYLIISDDISPEIWDFLEGCWNYSFVEFEFKEIIEYAYSVLWPNTPPKNALKGYEIEFIKTGLSIRDWTAVRDELNPLFDKKS
jgi:hypothetical protein